MHWFDRGRSVFGTAVALAAALIVAMPQPVTAQGFLESLFGSLEGRRPPAPVPQTYAYAPSGGIPGYIAPSRPAAPSAGAGSLGPRHSGETSASYGGTTAFCVRTCDGRFFPIQRRAGVSPVELCRSFCPASRTMVFAGSRIDHAVAANGQRYANLDTAFLYRDKVVPGCTCNGRDAFGLARVDIAQDPTLRPGDIVATADGLATYLGAYGDKAKTAAFTPIDPSKGEWARRLAEIKVRPVPPPPRIAPVSDEPAKMTRKERRRAQAAR